MDDHTISKKAKQYKDLQFAYEEHKRRETKKSIEKQKREQWWITWFFCPAPGDNSDIAICPCIWIPLTMIVIFSFIKAVVDWCLIKL